MFQCYDHKDLSEMSNLLFNPIHYIKTISLINIALLSILQPS